MSAAVIDVAHTGPGTLAGRYLRQFWQPVSVAAELPVKRAKPIRLMSEDFTLYRGESGTPYVVAFRCAHRGTQLSTGWVRGDNIRCLYHGWTYDGRGQCVEQPAEPEPFCQKVRIRAYPTQEYLGLVFAFLGEGPAPPLPRYEELENRKLFQAFRSPVDKCNWFNRIDQAGDIVHPFFAHPQGRRHDQPPTVQVEETAYGLSVCAVYPDGGKEFTHYHMPNMNLFGGGSNERRTIAWRMPIDDEHYQSIGVGGMARALSHSTPSADTSGPQGSVHELGDAILRGDLTIDDIIHLPTAVLIQDYVVLAGQGAIAPRELDRLGREDAAIIALRKLWERELKAFAAGKAPTQWHRPGPLPVVSLPETSPADSVGAIR